jgi:hypothetical protein
VVAIVGLQAFFHGVGVFLFRLYSDGLLHVGLALQCRKQPLDEWLSLYTSEGMSDARGLQQPAYRCG